MHDGVLQCHPSNADSYSRKFFCGKDSLGVCAVIPLALSTGHGYMDVARPWSVSVQVSHTSANTRVHTQFTVPSAACVVKTPAGFLPFSLLYKNSSVLQI